MTHDFDGSEPWLSIPLEKLTWEELPQGKRLNQKAFGILCLRDMPYDDYLLTNHWRDLRPSVFARYNGQCICAKDAREVHHINYARKGFEWPEDLIALCSECHARWHATWRIRIGQELNR